MKRYLFILVPFLGLILSIVFAFFAYSNYQNLNSKWDNQGIGRGYLLSYENPNVIYFNRESIFAGSFREIYENDDFGINEFETLRVLRISKDSIDTQTKIYLGTAELIVVNNDFQTKITGDLDVISKEELFSLIKNDVRSGLTFKITADQDLVKINSMIVYKYE